MKFHHYEIWLSTPHTGFAQNVASAKTRDDVDAIMAKLPTLRPDEYYRLALNFR